MLLHDTHVHLEILLQKLDLLNPSIGELDPNINQSVVLSEIANSKIDELLINHKLVIQSTVSTNNYHLLYHLFNSNSKIFYLFGSHPELVKDGFEIDDYLMKQSLFFNTNINLNKVIGIGEVGLDYFYTNDENLIKTQKKLFQSQINLAIEYGLPLIIHCREAFDDLFEIIEKNPRIHNQFLIHCFTGGVEELKKVHKFGGKVAFGGISSYDSAIKLQEAVECCPITDYMIETDLPYLAPKEVRGQICLPEHILFIIKKIAEIKKIDPEDVLANSYHNTLKFFPKISELMSRDYDESSSPDKDYGDSIVN